MSHDVDSFLLGGSVTSAKFEGIGDSVTGKISDQPEMRAQTHMQTGKPLTWDDGSPKMQLVITLQTDEQDPSDADDDGKRRIYVKGSKKAGSKSMHDAVAGAIRTAGAARLQVGGTLAVAYVGNRKSEVIGFNDAKQYEAKYTPPSAGFFDQIAAPAQASAAPF